MQSRGRAVVLLAAVACFIAFPSDAKAGRMMFGNDELVSRIEKADGTDYKIDGTDYYLCRKITFHFFIAGLYVSDDGYVLQEGVRFKEYIPLSDAKIRGFQQEGLLPNPLPPYRISVFEYLIGYSLWLVIGVTVMLYPVVNIARRLRYQYLLKRLAKSTGIPLNQLRTIIDEKPQSTTQLVNSTCAKCGQRISCALDAHICPQCMSPVHNDCIPNAMDVRQTEEDRCSQCGAFVNRTAHSSSNE